MSEPLRIYLDIFVGNQEEHAKAQAEYDATYNLLAKSACIYGLPESLSELSEEQKDILKDLDVYNSFHFRPSDSDEDTLEIFLCSFRLTTSLAGWSFDIWAGFVTWIIKDCQQFCCTVYGRKGIL